MIHRSSTNASNPIQYGVVRYLSYIDHRIKISEDAV